METNTSAMRPEKFTIKLREALNSALEMASKNDNPEIACEHFLLALLGQSEGLARPLLERLGVSIPALEARLKDVIANLAHVRGGSQPQMGNELRKVLDGAEGEMAMLKDEYVSVEHFLLALLTSSCGAAKMLKESGVTRDKLMQALAAVRGNQRVTDEDPEGKYQ
ncbi:MAG: Clp protease N-terminal domain-containing protein, partial [Terrimicrobiaceae bacterium]